MDAHKRSSTLLRMIANCLDVPVEHFTQSPGGPSETTDVASVSSDRDASMQAHQLLQLYWSLPDQTTKDLAVSVIKQLAKEQAPQ